MAKEAERRASRRSMVEYKLKLPMKTLLTRSARAGATKPRRPQLQRILVAVDFSEESRSALELAAMLAARFDASLTLVHVVEPVFGPPDVALISMTGALSRERMMEQATVELRELRARMPVACRVVETTVRSGIAFFEITEAAKALGADLIVIGTHGYTGIKRALLGSTAEKVVRHAPCPVLVVRGLQPEVVV